MEGLKSAARISVFCFFINGVVWEGWEEGFFTAVFGNRAKESAAAVVEDVGVALGVERGSVRMLASSHRSIGIASVHAGKPGFHLRRGQEGEVCDVEGLENVLLEIFPQRYLAHALDHDAHPFYSNLGESDTKLA